MLIMISLLGIAAMAVFSCCDNCPTLPNGEEPYDGWVYTHDISYGWIYKIDTKTDTPVDSVDFEYEAGYNILGLFGSEDGRFLAATVQLFSDEQITRIYNAQTLAPITDLQGLRDCLFELNDNIMIAFASLSTYGTVISFYSLPDFALIAQDTQYINMNYAVLCEEAGLIYAVGDSNTANIDSNYIVTYDYKSHQVQEVRELRNDLNEVITPFIIDYSYKHDRLYYVAQMQIEDSYSIVGCIELSTNTHVFIQRCWSGIGNIKLTPDENYLYRTDPGYVYGPHPGTVYVFDAHSGAYIEGISLYGYHYWKWVVPANNIAFTPNGKKAYIASGRISYASGGLFVVDTQTRDITKFIWPDLDRFNFSVVVVPKL